MKPLLIYNTMDRIDLIEKMRRLSANSQICDMGEIDEYCECVHDLIEIAETYGLNGNLWHSVTALLLANSENAFSRACEKTGNPDSSISLPALMDFKILRELFVFDWEGLDQIFGMGLAKAILNYVPANKNVHVFNTRVRDRICLLAKELSGTKDAAAFYDRTAQFYLEYGVGKLGLHKAFRIVHDKNENPVIQPITCTEHVYLNQLVGYERQKKKLIDNTKNFVDGKEANNVLLYGDAGTGKSSCIKAIMNEYYEQGLRLIEVYKHQFKDLPKIIAQIKNRNYKFIIYMDDLSFEEFEIEYKYLKAVIEGGLENKPDNVLIYATSNRRHLVKETSMDSKDYDTELHSSDTVQEKLSLVTRFGVTIYFGSPAKKEYEEIVRVLAKRAGIRMDEDALMLEANKWELTHGGRSGRCAQQFIVWLKGQMDM